MADKEHTNTYLNGESEVSMVAEASAEYAASKHRGHYTLEDYLALPVDQRVELIDGELYDMAAPTLIHQSITGMIFRCFVDYIRAHNGSCRAFISPVDVQLDCDDKTIVQPDVMIVCDHTKLRKERIYGAPDLVVEVLSPSTSRKDRVLKLSKYKAAGVREYWIVDAEEKRVWVYDLAGGGKSVIYGFANKVPVEIFDGDCMVDFKEIEDWLDLMNI